MNYWWNCLTKNFANFEGRARREEIWMFWLFNVIISFVAFIPYIGYAIASIFSLWALIPGIAVAVRRLHDTGRSGWWYFIALVPVIGWIWFFVLVYFIDSQPGYNQYGPNPKGM